MKASIVDLRYHMHDVLKALSRNESVTIMYHGEEKGIIMPIKSTQTTLKIQDTAMFGMYSDDQETVEVVMNKLRGGRYSDL